jgi:dUTP pyrophosphatase
MSEKQKVYVQKLDDTVPMPAYAKSGDAGADLISTIDVTIYPEERVIIPTGLAVALPDGYVGLVHPRSGLAAKNGISIVNTPGTVDAGYRGEIKVILINHDKHTPFEVRKGDRIAQLLIQKVERVEFVSASELDSTDRGLDGFGSTGVQ